MAFGRKPSAFRSNRQGITLQQFERRVPQGRQTRRRHRRASGLNRLTRSAKGACRRPLRGRRATASQTTGFVVPPSCPTSPPLRGHRSPTARANSTAVSPSACMEGVDESSPEGRHPEARPRRIRRQAVMTERTPAPATSDPAIGKRKAGDRHQGRPDAAASSCRTGPEDLDSRRSDQVEAVTRSGDFTGWPQIASGSKAAGSSRSRESSSCASTRDPCPARYRPHSAPCMEKTVPGRLSPSPTTQGPPALRNLLLKGCPGHMDTGALGDGSPPRPPSMRRQRTAACIRSRATRASCLRPFGRCQRRAGDHPRRRLRTHPRRRPVVLRQAARGRPTPSGRQRKPEPRRFEAFRPDSGPAADQRPGGSAHTAARPRKSPASALPAVDMPSRAGEAGFRRASRPRGPQPVRRLSSVNLQSCRELALRTEFSAA